MSQHGYDLEDRTFEFARRVRRWVKSVPRSLANDQDVRQLVRSSGSVGANYIEANESLSRRDFVMRVKISRKEAKESHYWLRLIDLGSDGELETERRGLMQEADELMKIFGAICRKAEGPGRTGRECKPSA